MSVERKSQAGWLILACRCGYRLRRGTHSFVNHEVGWEEGGQFLRHVTGQWRIIAEHDRGCLILASSVIQNETLEKYSLWNRGDQFCVSLELQTLKWRIFADHKTGWLILTSGCGIILEDRSPPPFFFFFWGGGDTRTQSACYWHHAVIYTLLQNINGTQSSVVNSVVTSQQRLMRRPFSENKAGWLMLVSCL